MVRIAHFSDPHFAKFTLNPSQFLSKRWIGNLNLLFFRSQSYCDRHLRLLPPLFNQLNVEKIFLTGDLTTTSRDEEFLLAKEFISQFDQPVFVLPGNHDCYTKETEAEALFYRHFESTDLLEKKVEMVSLGKGWFWIALDCTLATPVGCSYGLFSETIEKNLKEVLEKIPRDASIIVGNHFPLYGTGTSHHQLKRCKELKALLQHFPNVKLYLHGHDHKGYTIEGHPLVHNSGSAAHKKMGRFALFDLSEEKCVQEEYVWDGIKGAWTKESTRWHPLV